MIYLGLIDTEEGKRKFESIYLSHRQTMFWSAYHILKNYHSSEDAVHQAFLRIIDCLDKIDEENYNRTRAFLIAVTENVAFDIYRRQKREDVIFFDRKETYIPDQVSLEDETAYHLFSALESLPPNYSSVLRLKFSQGYNDSEIAEILGITEVNVRQRISRAKKKLAQLLQKED